MGVSRRHKSRRKKVKPRSRFIRSRRQIAIFGIALAALIILGLFLYRNVIPSNPTEVVVIIAKGAGENLHLGFEPSEITIVIGVNNTVVWKNEDSDWHTAHSNIPEFNSGLIQPGDSFTHTFQRTGIYPYHCDPHPWMTGIVTVKSATSTNMITYLPYLQTSQKSASFTMTFAKFEMRVALLSAEVTFEPYWYNCCI